MINNSDKVYQDLLQNILDNGVIKTNRTGVDTISIPHACIEFDMSEGFPLLTTKEMFIKGITHELLWFLNGDTNIKYLNDNNVTIWNGDAYREFRKRAEEIKEAYENGDMLGTQPHIEVMFSEGLTILTKKEFKESIINNDEFAKEWGELGPIYGKQWVNWESSKNDEQGPDYQNKVTSINQIQEVIDKLKNNPDDRRMIVSAWNIAEIDQMALPPCHYDFHLYTEEMTFDERREYFFENAEGKFYHPHYDDDTVDNIEGIRMSDDFDRFMTNLMNEERNNVPTRKISLIWDQRSVDTFLGLPFNIASYGILLHMFAQQANMVPDKLVGHLKNVHIYSNHVEQCEEQISREPMVLPQLELDKVDDIFSYGYENVKFVNYVSHPSIKGEISV